MSSDSKTGTQQSSDALAGKLKRTELQHKESSIPGREIVQVLTEIPCGVESGWHIHPGEEVGYIVAGTVEMRIQDQPHPARRGPISDAAPNASQRSRRWSRHRPDAFHVHRRGRSALGHLRRRARSSLGRSSQGDDLTKE
jgi:hypothetical protein